MMLLWMDVTHTNRHVSSSEKLGLLENNGEKSRRGDAECGRKDKALSFGTLYFSLSVTALPDNDFPGSISTVMSTENVTPQTHLTLLLQHSCSCVRTCRESHAFEPI